MSEHRHALARTINEAWDQMWLGRNPHGTHALVAIDALRAEGWSIVRLREVPSFSDLQEVPVYVITEGEA